MKVDEATAGLVPAPFGPADVTVTAVGPGVPEGVRTVTEMPPGSLASTVAATPPNRTTGVALPKPEPLMTTCEPPAAGPDDGESPVTAGQPALAPVSGPSRAAALGVPHPVARS